MTGSLLSEGFDTCGYFCEKEFALRVSKQHLSWVAFKYLDYQSMYF